MLSSILPKLLAITTIMVPMVPPASAAASCGPASWYGQGDGFAWRTMANGAPMDPAAMITAHRFLPFGTRLRVVNQNNGRSVVVRVTDRGPFAGGRVLDLSHGAFSRIASPGQGVARVCYQAI
jgi:rare lipoprotein A